MKNGVKLNLMKKLLLLLLLFPGLMSIVSAEPVIKETNFVNDNHKLAVKEFNELYGYLQDNKAEIESAQSEPGGELSGKKIFCKGINNERYGYYFVFQDQMLVFRLVFDSSRGYVELGLPNVIHFALEVFKGQYYTKPKEIILGDAETVNRETLNFYQASNPRLARNNPLMDHKKVGKCEIFEGDMYLKFKELSDHYGKKYLDKQEKQKKEQEEKNQL